MQMSAPMCMLICVRTTLNLSDGLAEEAKRRAAEEGRTLTSLIEEGLRLVLETPRRQRSIRLPAHGRGDGKVLVDILDKEALWAALEDADDPV